MQIPFSNIENRQELINELLKLQRDLQVGDTKYFITKLCGFTITWTREYE